MPFRNPLPLGEFVPGSGGVHRGRDVDAKGCSLGKRARAKMACLPNPRFCCCDWSVRTVSIRAWVPRGRLVHSESGCYSVVADIIRDPHFQQPRRSRRSPAPYLQTVPQARRSWEKRGSLPCLAFLILLAIFSSFHDSQDCSCAIEMQL